MFSVPRINLEPVHEFDKFAAVFWAQVFIRWVDGEVFRRVVDGEVAFDKQLFTWTNI